MQANHELQHDLHKNDKTWLCDECLEYQQMLDDSDEINEKRHASAIEHNCVVTGMLYKRDNRNNNGNTYYMDIVNDAGESTGKTISVVTMYSTNSFHVGEMVQITIHE